MGSRFTSEFSEVKENVRSEDSGLVVFRASAVSMGCAAQLVRHQAGRDTTDEASHRGGSRCGHGTSCDQPPRLRRESPLARLRSHPPTLSCRSSRPIQRSPRWGETLRTGSPLEAARQGGSAPALFGSWIHPPNRLWVSPECMSIGAGPTPSASGFRREKGFSLHEVRLPAELSASNRPELFGPSRTLTGRRSAARDGDSFGEDSREAPRRPRWSCSRQEMFSHVRGSGAIRVADLPGPPLSPPCGAGRPSGRWHKGSRRRLSTFRKVGGTCLQPGTRRWREAGGLLLVQLGEVPGGRSVGCKQVGDLPGGLRPAFLAEIGGAAWLARPVLPPGAPWEK